MQTLKEALSILESMELGDFNSTVEQASYKALRDLLERLEAIRKMPGFPQDKVREQRTWNRLEGLITRRLDRVVYGVQPTFTYMWDHINGDPKQPYAIRALGVRYRLRPDGSIPNQQDIDIGPYDKAETAYRRPYFYQSSRAIDVSTEDNPNQYEKETLDSRVMHIEFFISGSGAPKYAPSSPEEKTKVINRLIAEMQPQGYQYIGLKAKGYKPIAVFIKGKTIRKAIETVAGRNIAKEIIDADDQKKIQNLVIMLCRVGWKARIKFPVILQGFDTQVPDDRLDGVIAGLDKANSKILKKWFKLPNETKIITGSYLGKDFMDKGTVLLDIKTNFFADKPKLGKWGTSFNLSNFMIHDMDNLALSKSRNEQIHPKDEEIVESERNTHQGPAYYISISIKQLWIYCFSPEEQETLINKVILPEIERAGRLGGKFHELSGVERLMSMGVTISNLREYRIRDRLKTWVLQAALNSPIEGMYVLAAPDPRLKPFEIKVPLKAQNNGYEIDDIIDGGRHPMLPVGNGIQRFKIVGFTTGNFCQVGETPWTTIMGGDFDGDTIFLTKAFVKLFPEKKWDKTLMADIKPQTSIRPGVKSQQERVKQSVIVMSQAIGIPDFAARQAWEIGRLDRKARLTLSRAIQAEIDTAKHNVIRDSDLILADFRPRKINGIPIQYATGIVRNAKNEEKHKLLSVTKDLPFHRMFVKAYEVIEQKLPTKHLDEALIKGKADTIPDDDTFGRQDWLDLRRYGRNAAISANRRFTNLFENREPDNSYQMLADNLTIWLELQAMEVAKRDSIPWSALKRLAPASLDLRKNLAKSMMSDNEKLPQGPNLLRIQGAVTKPATPSRKLVCSDKVRILHKRYRAARNYLLLQLGGKANWLLICRLGIPGWEDIIRAATPADPVTIDPETRLILSKATQAEIDNAGH